MISAKDHLRHLLQYLTAEEAEQLLDAADQLCLLGNADLVTKSCACPSCGERRMDKLQWKDDHCVICATCASSYDPNPDEPRENGTDNPEERKGNDA